MPPERHKTDIIAREVNPLFDADVQRRGTLVWGVEVCLGRDVRHACCRSLSQPSFTLVHRHNFGYSWVRCNLKNNDMKG